MCGDDMNISVWGSQALSPALFCRPDSSLPQKHGKIIALPLSLRTRRRLQGFIQEPVYTRHILWGCGHLQASSSRPDVSGHHQISAGAGEGASLPREHVLHSHIAFPSLCGP